jgi:hypothetical protein
MRVQLQTFLLVLVLAGACSRSNAQAAIFSTVVRHQSISTDLANALGQIAWLSDLPMVAELAKPLPRIQIAEGMHSVEYLLLEIVRQAPENEWERAGRVIYFHNKKLKYAKFNFLNLRFPRFAMPNNVSEIKLTFPQREYGLLQGYSGGGIVTTGFGDARLQKDLLQPATLVNVTGREILLQVANESPTFFTVIVFPNAEPTKKQMEQEMNRNWFWQALKDEHLDTLYVQPSMSTNR